jgi:CRISPR/Cas system-associated exonuclease Cas4 (RecB family)
VHAVLERLVQPGDLSLTIDQLHSEGLIRENDKKAIHAKVSALFNQSLFNSFFDPEWEVFTEREIVKNGTRYKPDRVIVNNKRAVVVDYKREKEHKKHHNQVIDYAILLESMGYKNVEKYLVYVLEQKIVQA